MSTIDIRLPWGRLNKLVTTFLHEKTYVILGCLSSEDRCRAVPLFFSKQTDCTSKGSLLLQIVDPPDKCPDYTPDNRKKTASNEELLKKQKISFNKEETQLLADETELYNLVNNFYEKYDAETVILDISTFPKRYYSLFLKRLITSVQTKNIIVTYTQPDPGGYPSSNDHLADNVLSPSHLPGFAPKLGEEECTLVISLGFERFNINSLLTGYRDNNRAKFLLNFPPNGEYFRRQWKILRELLGSWDAMRHLEVVPALDVEQLYLTLDKLNKDSNGLTLAPFGPKTHTLGMVLFAIKYDRGLIYSQPQSYSPDYSRGIGESWGYVVKWNGIPCYNRNISKT